MKSGPSTRCSAQLLHLFLLRSTAVQVRSSVRWMPTTHQCGKGHLPNPTAFPYLYREVCLLAGCLTSRQHASASQGRICSDNYTCCHTEREVADQTFYLILSQYTDTVPTSPSADPITPGAVSVATGVPILKSLVVMTQPCKTPKAQAGIDGF